MNNIRAPTKSPLRQTNYIKDIKGTDNQNYERFDTTRHTNPLEPNYELPGGTETYGEMTKEISNMYSKVINKEIVLANTVRYKQQNKMMLRSEHPSQDVNNVTTNTGPMTENFKKTRPMTENFQTAEPILISVSEDKGIIDASNVTSVNKSQTINKSFDPNNSQPPNGVGSEMFVSNIAPRDPAPVAVSALAESQTIGGPGPETLAKHTEPLADSNFSNVVESKPPAKVQVP